MSALAVSMTKLQCDADGCGAFYENVGRPAAHIRELAAADGWRHTTVPHATSNWCRAVDLCPKCKDDAQLVPHVSSRSRRRR